MSPAPGGQIVDLISPGPGGIWFAYGSSPESIGFSTLDGHITAPIATATAGDNITGLAVDHDGTAWYSVTGQTGSAVWRVNGCGHAQKVPIPSAGSSGLPSSPSEPAIGADGNVWFLDLNANAIGRVTVSTLSPLPPCLGARMAQPAAYGVGIASGGTPAAAEVVARGGALRPNLRA